MYHSRGKKIVRGGPLAIVVAFAINSQPWLLNGLSGLVLGNLNEPRAAKIRALVPRIVQCRIHRDMHVELGAAKANQGAATPIWQNGAASARQVGVPATGQNRTIGAQQASVVHEATARDTE
ncbi:MAG: hypothetical protein JF612_14005 [Planctomycetia bacterium]|nr:hypothetical protein [Planctomycetia bacterium]